MLNAYPSHTNNNLTLLDHPLYRGRTTEPRGPSQTTNRCWCRCTDDDHEKREKEKKKIVRVRERHRSWSSVLPHHDHEPPGWCARRGSWPARPQRSSSDLLGIPDDLISLFDLIYFKSYKNFVFNKRIILIKILPTIILL